MCPCWVWHHKDKGLTRIGPAGMRLRSSRLFVSTCAPPFESLMDWPGLCSVLAKSSACALATYYITYTTGHVVHTGSYSKSLHVYSHMARQVLISEPELESLYFILLRNREEQCGSFLYYNYNRNTLWALKLVNFFPCFCTYNLFNCTTHRNKTHKKRVIDSKPKYTY